MGTLMLLGGSNCQINAACMAKAMGHRVILADYLPNPPAAAICDVHVRASTFDVQACLTTAREHQVDGIFTMGTDQPVYTAALVANALSLPSPIGVETALKATDKRAMKDAFASRCVPHVPFAYLTRSQGAEALSGLVPPLVLKPLDSQGQRGVFKVDTKDAAIARLHETLSFSRQDTALAESFYPSEEVTLSAFLHKGRVYPLTLTDRQLVEDPVHIGVCAAHRYPSIHQGRGGEIAAIAERVAMALGVTEGALYIQFLIGAGGIVVNEAACRIGGAYEDVFIPFVTGFDILRASIQLALGREPDVRALAHPGDHGGGRQISVQMLFCRPGVAASITPLSQILALPGVLAAGYNYAQGSTLPAMENATARFGYCVLATEAGDMVTRVNALYDTLRVRDPYGRNLVIPRSYDGEVQAYA